MYETLQGEHLLLRAKEHESGQLCDKNLEQVQALQCELTTLKSAHEVVNHKLHMAEQAFSNQTKLYSDQIEAATNHYEQIIEQFESKFTEVEKHMVSLQSQNQQLQASELNFKRKARQLDLENAQLQQDLKQSQRQQSSFQQFE